MALPGQAQTAEQDGRLCQQAIAEQEPGSGLPPGLLHAIAIVESGRRLARTGRVIPWPWSYNVSGRGYMAATKAQAVAEVSALLAAGQRSIDIGCMQINLLHHPESFSSLDEAFDPQANLRYAVRFLRELHARHGDWNMAVRRYHSGQPDRGEAYRQRVEAGAGSIPQPTSVSVVPPAARAWSFALLPGLATAERQSAERHQAALAQLATLRSLATTDPAAALRALGDPRQFSALSAEQRAGMANLSRFYAGVQAARSRARAELGHGGARATQSLARTQ
ncbi:lytic transglycosylase domain-containing protein [Pararoseomonas baculiformis]|nr:lytic transglycosylase domain-containing protein [Pararoseomonas baculiformis]